MARVIQSLGYTREWLGKEHWGTSNAGLGFGNANDDFREMRKDTEHFRSMKQVGRLPEKATTFDKNVTNIDTILVDKAKMWLEDYNDSKPFLHGVSLYLPHFPLLVEKKYFDMYKDVIDVPRVMSQMIEDLPITSQRSRIKYNIVNLTKLQIKKARAVYYGMVSFVDEQVGRLVQKLNETGSDQNTVVVYVSDHGELAGEHGLWYKNSFLEDSVRVPLIISDRQTIPPKTVKRSPVQAMDLAPTLYELCNITIRPELDGKSLMPIVRGEETGWSRHVISETVPSKIAEGRMIRWKNWKYCTYADGKKRLFDLKNDTAEEFNLYKNMTDSDLVKWLHNEAMKDYISEFGNTVEDMS